MAALSLDCGRALLNAGRARVFNFSNPLMAILIACFLLEVPLPAPVLDLLELTEEDAELQPLPDMESCVQFLASSLPPDAGPRHGKAQA